MTQKMTDRGQVDAGLEERDRRAVANAVGVQPLLAQIRSCLSRKVQAVCENVPDAEATELGAALIYEHMCVRAEVQFPLFAEGS